MTRHALFLVLIALTGAVALTYPAISRRGVYFGVTVPEHALGTDVARRIRRDYRILVVTGILLAISWSFWRKPGESALLIVALNYAAWIMANRRARALAGPPQPRVASLAARDAGLPGGVALAAGPFVILAVAALFLYLTWDQIPDRVPRRWSLDGTVRRWSDRTIRSVYGPLVVALFVATMSTLQGVFIMRRTRQVSAVGSAAEGEHGFKRLTAGGSLAVGYAVAVMSSSMAILPHVSPALMPALGWLFLAIPLTVAGVLFLQTYRAGQGGHRASDSPATGQDDGTSDARWIGGILYFNRSDPALLVENRMGPGWTLNLGHRGAWLFIAFMVAFFIAFRFWR